MATTWRNQLRSHSPFASGPTPPSDSPRQWSFGGLAIVVVVIVIANAWYLVGMSNPDAIGWTSQIASVVCHHGLCLQPSIDPNAGFITQVEGHLAAMDWLHFHLPWWNPFTGLGAPLAGEMQSGALSPLVLLFALPGGLLWFHMALEVISGVSAYLLVRRLFPTELLACVGGILFGLNGTLAWVGNAVENPVPFLPLALLGVELIIRGVGRKRWGWSLLAIAIALSMYAGFPEVAALDDLLVVVYALVRGWTLPRGDRKAGIGQLAWGLGVGGLLSLPILVAFKDFLKVALIGIHSNASAALISPKMIPMFLDPYIYGGLAAYHSATPYWDGAGGYFTMGVFVLALFGLTGPTQRPLRWAMGGWVAISLMGATNALGTRALWNLIPGLHQIVLGRYVIASCEMAMILLALFGLDDLIARRRGRVTWMVTGSLAIVTFIAMLLWVSGVTAGSSGGTLNELMVIAGRSIPFVLLLVIVYAGFQRSSSLAAVLIAGALTIDALFSFGLAEVFVPAKVTEERGPIAFLQKNLGLYRFASAGPISPNWGTYFSINELNAHDLPFPAAFANFVNTQLPIGMAQSPFMYMVYQGVAESADYEASMAARLGTFENAGVKYLVTYEARPMNPTLRAEGLRLAYADGTLAIYQLPAPQAFYTANNCTTSQVTFSSMQVTCSKASTLVRRELWMPGWSASVNGRGATVGNEASLPSGNGVMAGVAAPYQVVSLPQGSSTVRFHFLPPHERLAEGGFLVGVIAMAWAWRQNRQSTASRARRRAPRRTWPFTK